MTAPRDAPVSGDEERVPTTCCLSMSLVRTSTQLYCQSCNLIHRDLNRTIPEQGSLYRCWECNGTGRSMPVENLGTCRHCGGSGVIHQ